MKPMISWNPEFRTARLLEEPENLKDLLKLDSVTLEYNELALERLKRDKEVSCRLSSGQYLNLKFSRVALLGGMIMGSLQSIQISDGWAMPLVTHLQVFGNVCVDAAKNVLFNGSYRCRGQQAEQGTSVSYTLICTADGQLQFLLKKPVELQEAMEFVSGLRSVLTLDNTEFEVSAIIYSAKREAASGYNYYKENTFKAGSKVKSELLGTGLLVRHLFTDSNLAAMVHNIEDIEESYEAALPDTLKILLLSILTVRSYELLYKGYQNATYLNTRVRYAELGKLDKQKDTGEPPVGQIMQTANGILEWKDIPKERLQDITRYVVMYRNTGVHSSKSLEELLRWRKDFIPAIKEWMLLMNYALLADVWGTTRYKTAVAKWHDYLMK